MERSRVLLIHSLGSSLPPIRKLLEERNLSVHLSRTWEEAEKTYQGSPRVSLNLFLQISPFARETDGTNLFRGQEALQRTLPSSASIRNSRLASPNS